MKKLRAFYFSGTGNTSYVTRDLCKKLSEGFDALAFDISGTGELSAELRAADCVLLAFPVYGSSPPVPMRRFVYDHADVWKGKEVIVVATQYMFSGDGAASLGRSVEKLGGRVTFAEHFNMPNNLADCTAFKIRNGEELEESLRKTEKRIDAFARKILKGRHFRRGFNPFSHAVGYFSQRKWWRKGENAKKNDLKIDEDRCVACGLCAKNCPVKNIVVENGKARPQGNCALCYRCVNLCPRKAITLCGKEVPANQYKGLPR